MNTLINEHSIVVGVDVHKYGHTAVAMNAWGEEKGKIDFSNTTLETYTQWLERMGLKENIVIGLEDVNSYGRHLVERLRSENFHIRYVPAILTERERKQSTKRHKSDEVDAKWTHSPALHGKLQGTLPPFVHQESHTLVYGGFEGKPDNTGNEYRPEVGTATLC